MLKKFSKLLSLILVLCMILPGFVFSENMEISLQTVNSENVQDSEDYDELKNVKPIIEEALSQSQLELGLDYEGFKPKDEVRVIVELEDKPTIAYATEKSLSFNEIPKNKIDRLEKNLITEQSKVRNMITAKDVHMKYLNQFTTVFNGFSGEIEFDELETIKRLPGVKKVYISNEYKAPEVQPEMITSNSMVESGKAWDLNYKGEGMVVAVIDTGVDPDHRDMLISNETEVDLTEEDVDEIISKNSGMKGKYYSKKVPFGYNYYDLNYEILDKRPNASEHGMHVAGTVAANGDVENGGLRGVAPEAQILAMKVFSNDPIYSTTFDDVYIKAIEDSVKLGADVINMSLGSTAAFNDSMAPSSVAITNAVENGIVCAVSAGNSGQITYGWSDTNKGLPLKKDPDIGLVGAPGLSVDSLQVASIENTKLMSPYIKYEGVSLKDSVPVNSVIVEEDAYDIRYLNNNSNAQRHLITTFNNGKPIYVKLTEKTIVDLKGNKVVETVLPTVVNYYDANGRVEEKSPLTVAITGDTEVKKTPMIVAGDKNPSKVFSGPVEYVDCKNGTEADFKNIKVKDKIALIIRGDIGFTDKISNAEKAGASGVIIYNHPLGGEELINMMYPDGCKIPAVFIGYKGGKALLDAQDKSITFADDLIHIDNINSGLMSDFTSWGTTPDLELKPEITAPGGQIYSTLQNNRYGMMSGTSMSSPHVAGGSALVMEYIKKHDKYKNLSLEEQARFAKLLLMNTASVVKNPDYKGIDQVISPRRQGAGLMNLYSAISTPVTVFDKKTEEGKVNLKDFLDTSFTMELVAENHTENELTYKVNVDVLADKIVYDKDAEEELNMLSTREMNADVSVPQMITIPPNSQKEFMVTVDFSHDTETYRNMFVEGFVSLEEVTDTYPTLSLPYMGFYGDWNEPSIFDGMKVIDKKSYYGMAGMAGVNKEYELSYYDDLAMSPYTDDGKLFGKSVMFPILSLMRNAKKLEFNILDENKVKLTSVYRDQYVSKSYVDGGHNLPAYLIVNAAWDGKIGKTIVPDGQYYYQIRAIIDYENAVWQEKNIPIIVDTKKPEITNISFDNETKVISWNAIDTGSAVVGFLITLDGSQVGEVMMAKDEVSEYEFDLTQYIGDSGAHNVKIFSFDRAMNTIKVSKEISLENAEPELYLLKPGLFEISKGEVLFQGCVFGVDDVESILINGEKVEFEFNEDTVLIDPKDKEGKKVLRRGPGYTFKEIKEFESGIYETPVTVKTRSGKEKTIIRRYYVDKTTPNMIANVLERDPASETVKIEITMSDNFPYLKLFINGSDEYLFDGMNKSMGLEAGEVTETFTVPVNVGRNRIELVLVDIAGNQVVKFITVERTEASTEKLPVTESEETSVETSDVPTEELMETPVETKYEVPIEFPVEEPIEIPIESPVLAPVANY